MTHDHTNLRALALAATPGPWTWWTSNSYRRLSSDATRKDGDVLRGVAQRDGHPDIACSEADRAYIAAANPAAILVLLAELEREHRARCEAEAIAGDTLLKMDELSVKAAELEQDAERYRWLCGCGDEWETLSVFDFRGSLDGDALDEVVDAAITAAKGVA